MNFRSHEGFGSASIIFEGDPFSFVLEPAGKAEISNFQNIFPVLLKDQDVVKFEVSVGHAFLVQVVEGFDDLAEENPLAGEVRFIPEEMLEEITFGGMLENEDVMRGWLRGLLILLITHEGHILAVFQAADYVRVPQILQRLELIFQVPLLLPVAGGYHLQDQPLLSGAVPVYLRVSRGEQS